MDERQGGGDRRGLRYLLRLTRRGVCPRRCHGYLCFRNRNPRDHERGTGQRRVRVDMNMTRQTRSSLRTARLRTNDLCESDISTPDGPDVVASEMCLRASSVPALFGRRRSSRTNALPVDDHSDEIAGAGLLLMKGVRGGVDNGRARDPTALSSSRRQ